MKVSELPTDLDFGDVLEAAEANAKNDFEMDFVAEMVERFDQYEDRMFISDKQWELLAKIARID